MHPLRVKKKKEFRLDSNDCGFICAGANLVGGYNEMSCLVLSELIVINLLLFEHQQKNCSLADSFLDPMA